MYDCKERGFTLIEVVLAIAVGLIIIAGVSTGYTYAKRAAIIDNQRKDVAAIKSFIEQAIATAQANPDESGMLADCNGGICAPGIEDDPNDVFCGLAQSLPSLMIDPYNGNPRCSNGVPNPCPGSCIASMGDDEIDTLESAGGPWPEGAGSGVFYARSEENGLRTPIAISLADGSQRTFYGYAVFETDDNGNIVAADGGSLEGEPAPPSQVPN